jgi:hypothetical protein
MFLLWPSVQTHTNSVIQYRDDWAIIFTFQKWKIVEMRILHIFDKLIAKCTVYDLRIRIISTLNSISAATGLSILELMEVKYQYDAFNIWCCLGLILLTEGSSSTNYYMLLFLVYFIVTTFWSGIIKTGKYIICTLIKNTDPIIHLNSQYSVWKQAKLDCFEVYGLIDIQPQTEWWNRIQAFDFVFEFSPRV